MFLEETDSSSRVRPRRSLKRGEGALEVSKLDRNGEYTPKSK